MPRFDKEAHQESVKKLLEPLSKHVEATLTDKHDSLLEPLFNEALEKDILLTSCKNFGKFAISPLYNTKILQEHIASVESSIYSRELRHYIPILAPKARDKMFKPALSLITNWLKFDILKLGIKGLEQDSVKIPSPGGSEDVLKPVKQAVQDRFQILHPDLWDGLIKNDDIVSKVTEIATEMIYYTTLDDEISQNYEAIKVQNGKDYAYNVSSFLQQGMFSKIRDRGYFLESEEDMLLNNMPSLMCPTECSEGFFNEMLKSCTKTQHEIVSKMFDELPRKKIKNLPKDAVTFDKLLLYIIAKTKTD